MDAAAQWTQELVMKPIEEIVSYPKDRKARPQKDSCLNCPRCTSTNTKFCYYNNYSLSQPRYFCKTCRRYWTEGGSLRNIPVGGGSRKNKKQQTENQKKKNNELQAPPPITQQNPRKNMEDQDLNLGFSDMIQVTNFGQKDPSSSAAAAAIGSHYSFLPLPLVACGGDPSTLYSPGFPTLPEFLKPSSLSFSLDGIGGNYGSFHGVQESNGKQLLFPLEDLKQVSGSNTSDAGQNTDQNGGDSNGIWSRVIGGGAWYGSQNN